MPIDKVSNIRRLPRIDKIRLGLKKEGDKGPYPTATPYFVCSKEVQAVYGEQPTELRIYFPSNEMELVAPQYLKCYTTTHGLTCRGNGKTCERKVDNETGNFANKDTKTWERLEGVCDPAHCPKYGSKQCRPVMSLVFLLRDVPGVGVYQLDTSSFRSIVNVNSQIAKAKTYEDGHEDPAGLIRSLTKSRLFPEGRIAFIPLVLALRPEEANPQGVGRKTVYVLSIQSEGQLTDLLEASRKEAAQVLLPTLKEEEPPEDLTTVDAAVAPAGHEEGQAPVEGASAGDVASNNREAVRRAEAAGEARKEAPPVRPPTPAEAATAEMWHEELGGDDKREKKTEEKSTPWLDVKEVDIKSMTDVFRFVAKYFNVSRNGKPLAMSSTDVLKELGFHTVQEVNIAPWPCWQTIVNAKTEESRK